MRRVLYTYCMKRIHMKYVIITGILLCLAAIYYYVAAQMLLESEVIAVPADITYTPTGTQLPIATSSTSSWEDVMLTMGGGCSTGSSTEAFGIATAGIPLLPYTEKTPVLSFSFVQCERAPSAFVVDGNRLYKIASGTQEQTVVAYYWELSEGESAEAFIGNLLKTLPTELERTWCTIKPKRVTTTDPWRQLFVPDEVVYQVTLHEDYYNNTSDRTSSDIAMCAPYGDGYGVSFFKQSGNYLFLIPVGQTVPTFSPASFEVR